MRRRLLLGGLFVVVGFLTCSLSGCSLEVFDDDEPGGGSASYDTSLSALAVDFATPPPPPTLLASKLEVGAPAIPRGTVTYPPLTGGLLPGVYDYSLVHDDVLYGPQVTATAVSGLVTIHVTLSDGVTTTTPQEIMSGVTTGISVAPPNYASYRIIVTVRAPDGSSTTYTVYATSVLQN